MLSQADSKITDQTGLMLWSFCWFCHSVALIYLFFKILVVGEKYQI